MKKVPKFLRDPFRNALKFALEEAIARDDVRQSRGYGAPSTTRRWFDLEEQVGGQIHDVQSWQLDRVDEGQCEVR